MSLLIICGIAWYLTGFLAPLLVWHFMVDDDVTLADVAASIFMGFFGVVTLLIVLIETPQFKNIIVWRRK